jgi:hypothetical protein
MALSGADDGTLRYRVADLEKRTERLERAGAGADHERRIADLEQYKPAVLQERLNSLADDVAALKRAFYTFAFGVVGSAIVFAFTVFALLGRH